MIEDHNPYLQQKLKKVSDPLAHSFSNQYTRWRHRYGIYKVFERELQMTKDKPIKILDIGCNEGYLIFELKQLFDKNYELYFAGIDINPELITFANERKAFCGTENCIFEVMDANELEFENNQFDIITCTSIIEHIKKPEIVMKSIRRILAPAGRVILTTPNGKGGIPEKLISVGKRVLRKCIKLKSSTSIQPQSVNISEDKYEKYDLGHVSINTNRKWVNIFNETGFQVARTIGTSGLIFGSPRLDKHRILFGATVIADVFLEHFLFGSYLWSIDSLYVLRKAIEPKSEL